MNDDIEYNKPWMDKVPFIPSVSICDVEDVGELIAFSFGQDYVADVELNDFKAIVDSDDNLVALVSPNLAEEMKFFLNNYNNLNGELENLGCDSEEQWAWKNTAFKTKFSTQTCETKKQT